MHQPTVFSSQLQQLRKERGVTQETLAEHLGVSPQAVSKWENGSFPDGDLLPRIADFFGVSIDYLYGRADRARSIEERVFDDIRDKKLSEDTLFDEIFELAWAAHISAWDGTGGWEPLPRYEKPQPRLASVISDNAGFSYFRMNEDLRFFSVLKNPPDGFAKRLGDAERFAPLFAFLGDTANLKILFYMLSLKDGDVVKASVVANRLELPKERVEKAFDYLCGIGGCGNKPFIELAMIDENDVAEIAYACRGSLTVTVLMLLAAADSMLAMPNGFQFQIGRQTEPWFRRTDLPFLKKEEGSENEKEKRGK